MEWDGSSFMCVGGHTAVIMIINKVSRHWIYTGTDYTINIVSVV